MYIQFSFYCCFLEITALRTSIKQLTKQLNEQVRPLIHTATCAASALTLAYTLYINCFMQSGTTHSFDDSTLSLAALCNPSVDR